MVNKLKDNLPNLVFPADELEGLSYYEVLCKVHNKLNEVIEQVNKNESNIGSFTQDMTDKYNRLLKAWQDTKDWIDHYFDNLDVQEEINQKLDAMVNDGTLGQVIEPFLQQYFPPEFVDNTGQMVNKNKNYILKSSGEIYSWNGTTFENTGVTFAEGKNGFYINTDTPSSIEDFNLVPINQFSLLSTRTYLNAPNTGQFSGFILHMEINSSYSFQLLYNRRGGIQLFYRGKWSGTWGDWEEITNISYANALVENMIKVNKLVPSGITDFNDVPINQFSLLSTRAYLNAPNTGQFSGFIYHMEINSSYSFQLLYNRRGGIQLFYRGKWSGTWGDWKEITNVNTEQIYINNLTNKTWFACGDSFTHGDFSGLDISPTFTTGKYSGQLKVYPFYIGNRTNCNVKNVARNGMLLSSNTNNNFINIYKTIITENPDYITLYFGINDSHNKVEIGDVNSTNTTEFCGALNTVLRHYITQYPFAKIGVIISNGCDSLAYPIATKSVAENLGVPYLDLIYDVKVPLMLRTDRPNVSEDIKKLKLTQQRVIAGNNHPSAEAHEYESYFIEEWLLSL